MRIIYFLLILLITNIVSADIIQTSDYSVVSRLVKNADKHSLIMFDLDDVLTLPTDPYNISFPERKYHVKRLEKKYGENNAKKFWSIILQNRKIKFVDERIPQILQDIRDKQIAAIAVTKCFTHQYGKIKNAHDWRIAELKSIKVDFSQTSPLRGIYKMSDIIPVNGRPSSIPLYKDGIVFTARADKGMILEKVFSHYKYFPKRILFIDDKFKNHTSIEKLSKKYRIKFDGIVITKAHNQQSPKLNPEVEKNRFNILENEERWEID